MSTIYVKQGDLGPSPVFQFIDKSTGTPETLTGWTLQFHMRSVETGTVVINRAAVVDTDPLWGRFDWEPGDTDVSGTYEAEVKATPPNNRPVTVPVATYLTVEIIPSLVPPVVVP